MSLAPATGQPLAMRRHDLRKTRRWCSTNGLQQPVQPVQLCWCGRGRDLSRLLNLPGVFLAANPRRWICGGVAVMFAGHNQAVLPAGNTGTVAEWSAALWCVDPGVDGAKAA